MPLGLIAGALNAGMGILQNSLQNKENRRAEERQHGYNVEMYNMQRRDALADWNMNNQYNSPEEQMRRFKAAGLNPNLIYGQQNTSDAVRSSSAAATQAIPTQVALPQIGDAINQMYNVQKAKNEVDNLQAQGELVRTENAIKGIQLSRDTQTLESDVKGKKADTTSKEAQAEVDNKTTKNKIEQSYQQTEQGAYQTDIKFIDRQKSMSNFQSGRWFDAERLAISNAKAQLENTLATTNNANKLLPHQIENMQAQAYNTRMQGKLAELGQAKIPHEINRIKKDIEVMEQARKKVEKENGYFDFNQWFNTYKGIMSIGAQGAQLVK